MLEESYKTRRQEHDTRIKIIYGSEYRLIKSSRSLDNDVLVEDNMLYNQDK